jgi:hypothetical protein
MAAIPKEPENVQPSEKIPLFIAPGYRSSRFYFRFITSSLGSVISSMA